MASGERATWTDERLGEKMAALDEKDDRIFGELADIRAKMRGMRSDLTAEIRSINGHLVRIGFGLVSVLIAEVVALVIALG
jgi:hypothetical protein